MAAAVGFGLVWAIQSVFASVPTTNTYAVDAISGGAVNASASVPVSGTFTFDTVITSAGDAWSAEQSNVGFNPAIISYVSGPVDTNLGGAALCGTGTVGGFYVYNGCAKASGSSTATGVTRSWTMKCEAPGSTALHLLTDTEMGGPALGTNFAIAAGEAEGPLVDASVTCTLPITKTDDTGTGNVTLGGTVTYTIHVGNPGLVSNPGHTVTDLVPVASLGNVTLGAPTNGTCDFAITTPPDTITCTGVAPEPDPTGWTLTYTVSADVAGNDVLQHGDAGFDRHR